jgi:hypothetical protein
MARQHCSLDQTAQFLITAWNPRRPWPKQVGAHSRNALLRQQLIMLKRQVKRPVCTKTDRILLVLLARVVRAWKQALLIVQPETLLRWHREAFRLYWKHKSKARAHKPKVATETIALIREMATKNRRLRSRADSWGTSETRHACM